MCATGIKLSNFVLIYGVIMDFITFLKKICSFTNTIICCIFATEM